MSVAKPAHEGATASGQERRRELIQAAYDLIATKGIEGLRIRDVAGQVGINNATLHYYFPTKEALIQAVVTSFIAQFNYFQSLAQDAGSISPVEQLHAYFEGLHAQMSQTPDRPVVMNELYLYARRDPATYHLLQQADTGWQNLLTPIFEAGLASGLFRPGLSPSSAALTVISFCKGISLLLNAGPEAIAATIDAFEQSFLAGSTTSSK